MRIQIWDSESFWPWIQDPVWKNSDPQHRFCSGDNIIVKVPIFGTCKTGGYESDFNPDGADELIDMSHRTFQSRIVKHLLTKCQNMMCYVRYYFAWGRRRSLRKKKKFVHLKKWTKGSPSWRSKLKYMEYKNFEWLNHKLFFLSVFQILDVLIWIPILRSVHD
jgi:hypothetical protein